jgi:hypothetical protein
MSAVSAVLGLSSAPMHGASIALALAVAAAVALIAGTAGAFPSAAVATPTVAAAAVVLVLTLHRRGATPSRLGWRRLSWSRTSSPGLPFRTARLSIVVG